MITVTVIISVLRCWSLNNTGAETGGGAEGTRPPGKEIDPFVRFIFRNSKPWTPTRWGKEANAFPKLGGRSEVIIFTLRNDSLTSDHV